jgi:hypothetical protein
MSVGQTANMYSTSSCGQLWLQRSSHGVRAFVQYIYRFENKKDACETRLFSAAGNPVVGDVELQSLLRLHRKPCIFIQPCICTYNTSKAKNAMMSVSVSVAQEMKETFRNLDDNNLHHRYPEECLKTLIRDI